MHANLIAHIQRICSRFVNKLVHVLPGLEKRARKAGLPTSNEVPNKSPLYVLGSSAAVDIAKTEESAHFPNIYSGILPPIGSSGTFTDQDNVTYNIEPLIASPELMQKRWRQYQSTAPDLDPNWETLEDLLGGYMHNSSSSADDSDDDTKFNTDGPIAPT
jgi:hypothetical protein